MKVLSDVSPPVQSFGFQYSSLPEKKAVVRLLELLPGDPDGKIRCELMDFEIKDADQKPYEALSYVWGEGEGSTEITVNNERMTIRPNLHLALQSLRNQDSARTFWVDAICIDQNNNKERGHQVNLMKSIFQGAKGVVVWLGEDTEQTNIAMDSLNYLADVLDKFGVGQQEDLRSKSLLRINVHHQEAVDGFRDLLQRQWYQRAWIVQEIALARSATIMCGKKSVSAGIFSSLSWMLEKSVEISPIEPLLNVMPGFLRERKDSWWTLERDLFALLLKFRDSKTTEQRDKIYAFLGIASDITNGNFEASYEISEQDLVQDIISFL
ncbi:HET-domain-containing protein, partial [Eremomyces bilateralis CBS 781.70]